VAMIQQSQGGFYISQIKQVQSRIFEKLLKANDIDEFNGAQGRILFILWQNDGIPIRELSLKTSLAKTTLTSMLDRMEAKGTVRRVPDPEDRRQIRIHLTETAVTMFARFQAVSNRMNEIFYRGLSDEERVRFDQTLAKILQNLKEYEG
jgi:DNA-binding MarR family transcriptional regulator